MTVYDTELAAVSRTPQVIVELGITSCQNWYAQTATEYLWATQEFDNVAWTKTGGCTVTPNTTVAPDGTTTADTIAFAVAGTDSIDGGGLVITSANRAFTGSVFLKAAAPGTITLRIHDTGTTESTAVVVNVTTAWTRFWNHCLFSGGAAGGAFLKIERGAGDLASVFAWGANLTRNPGDVDAEVRFPYVLSFSTFPNAGTCAAADAGDGSRCWYSFPTCQDPADFNVGHAYESSDLQGLKVFRFCLKNAPIPLGGEDIWPMIKSVDFTPQKIDPERAVTVNERVKVQFYDDAASWAWNQDKASLGAKNNTGTPSGNFWRRFARIYRNYSNPRNYAKVYVGYVASGMTYGLFQQRGSYILTNIEIGSDGLVTLTLADKLRLTKVTSTGVSQAKAPAKISETNLLNGGINNAVTSLVVDNAAELTPISTETPAGYNVCIEMSYDVVGGNEFMNVGSINTTTNTLGSLQRGRWGTVAKSHLDNAKWREVLQFGTEFSTPASAPLGKNPIDIVVELLKRPGLLAADIDTATLNDERDTWLAGGVTADVETGIVFKRAGGVADSSDGCIASQQDVEKFLKQIREAIMLNLFVNESSQVTGKVFAPARPSVTLTEITDATEIVRDSIDVDENEDSRVTRVAVAYDLFAGKSGDSLADYAKIIVYVGSDEESAGDYGDKRTRIVLCPWIKSSGSATAQKLASHLFTRYKNPARRVSFSLEIKDDGVKCGDFVNLTTAFIQKPDGSTDAQRTMEVLSKQRKADNSGLDVETLDTGMGIATRYGFIAPAGYPDYNAATALQHRYAYIGTATVNQVGTTHGPGYRIW
jgi:hypothetical protein